MKRIYNGLECKTSKELVVFVGRDKEILKVIQNHVNGIMGPMGVLWVG